ADVQAGEAAGVLGAAGGASAKPFNWGFSVVPPPQVTGTNPKDGEVAPGPRQISISFSAPMDHRSTEAAISVSPPPDPNNDLVFSRSGHTSAYLINYDLHHASQDSVSIAGTARDRYGAALPPSSFSFSVGAEPPPPAPSPFATLITPSIVTANAYLPVTVY